ncbi:hypothetical protein EPD60_14175 [Flaviaesturariibacter flavus]|uniref:Uncharacterized protein n=1 Tax=Flaviaesturariibacter flavus TaxID=2502780 RepID=A0A4R1B4M4_9BACT|nr:hypothetical protein [Flaviaesturariibacter flavus]TCJ12420.1 hypothetical protein EPD60_14175 [Flaviaesturariibacter flavus]
MKLSTLCLVLVAGLSIQAGCRKDKGRPATGCYRGKLAVKGICSNYTIQVTGGAIDTTRIQARWRDEVTGTTWTNVFALGSPCTFPASIREGEEFYFTIDEGAVQNCVVCMAYYPVPDKKLSIRVLDAPCTP